MYQSFGVVVEGSLLVGWVGGRRIGSITIVAFLG